MTEKRNIEIKVRLNRKEADNLFKRVKRSRLSREASYLLCKKYQISTADYNFSRLPASFRESDAQGVRAALTEIRDSANQISQRMYRALDQNRNPRGKEQER